MIFRVDLARASPPCIRWSGAAFADGLDHQEGMLILESLSICHSFLVKRIAIENVAAILTHRHWQCNRQFIKEILGKFLHVLKIDLQHYMPIKRLRAFLMICDDEHLPELELPRTWCKRHFIQAGAWISLFRAISPELQVNDLAYKAATDPQLLPCEWKNGCIECLITEADCLALRTISPWAAKIPSCMSQYGNQHQLNPRLLRYKGLLSYFIQDGRAQRGFRMNDILEFAWLLGFNSVKWPRAVGLAYKLLGNCVAPIHARIVNGWIATNWLKHDFCFQNLWDEYRNFDESLSRLGDFFFSQNDEWIWWAPPSANLDIQPITTHSVQVTVCADNRRFDCEVPFEHGLTMKQILSALYPCDWSKVHFAMHGGQRLQDVCLGSFGITIFDVRILIEGIGWIQISPFQPVRHVIEKVRTQRGFDISSFQLHIDGREVDRGMMIAALLPSNLFYLCDACGQRFVSFLTPSVKRQRSATGQFLPQPIVLPGGLNQPIAVVISISHSTGSDCICLTIEKDCGLSYLQVLKIALQDFTRPINFELVCPGGHHEDICVGSFQVRTFDFDFEVAPFGVETFSLFDRLGDVINRISLKHYGRLIDMTLLCNGQNCDHGQRLGTTNDSHCFRIDPIEGWHNANPGNNEAVPIPPVSSSYKVCVHQSSGCVEFTGMLESQHTFQEVVDAVVPCGSCIKWYIVENGNEDAVNETLGSSIALSSFEIFAFDVPIVVEPHGIFFFPPFADLNDLLRKVSNERYGGLANLAVRVNNIVQDMTTYVIVANQIGVIRTQLFQGFGGSPVHSKLPTLLVQHGVPQDSSGERATNLIEVWGVKNRHWQCRILGLRLSNRPLQKSFN